MKSVEDLDPDPQDPHDFCPPGSGYGSGSGSFPFLIRVLSGKYNLTQNFCQKFNFKGR
jgi:hypothetical protein